jgi:hypothetical protein
MYPAVYGPKKDDGTPFVPTDSQISAINIGTLKLYVFGYIQYRDEFSLFGYKETGYCYLFNPRGDLTKSSFTECCPAISRACSARLATATPGHGWFDCRRA